MSGIPQGSVLGPLLFLIYINDLPDGINSLCKIFADDKSLFSKVYDILSNLNDDLEKISCFFCYNNMMLQKEKQTKYTQQCPNNNIVY